MVDWYAMERVLCEIGMPNLFINWIKVAVTNVTYEFNVKGNNFEIMQARRGMRQWDPIPPLLFIVIMEYLDRSLVNMYSNLDFNFHAKCEKIGLTNLTFADDILLFCRGDALFIQMLMNNMKNFSASTGLMINPRKYKVYCASMDREEQTLIRSVIEFDEGMLPRKYLGVPITSKRLNIHHYLPFINKATHRMKHWTTKLLIYAGRVLLVKSIMLAVTQYWMQCLPMPHFVITQIDRLCMTFIWTGNLTDSRKILVAWSRVCSPKSK